MQQNNRIFPIEQITLIKKPTWSAPKVIGGSLSTFKKHTYTDGSGTSWESLISNGSYLLETTSPITSFTMSSLTYDNQLTIPSEYVLKGTIHATNAKGKLTEYSRTGDISTAIIWNTDGDLPLAKVVNAHQDEVFYTSFEEISGGSSKSRTGQKSRTGASDYIIDVSPLSLNTSEPYILSYWESNNGLDWDFKKLRITPTGSNITIILDAGNNYLDEVRLYPADAIMSTVSYDKDTRQITHMTNQNAPLDRFHWSYV